MTPLKTLALIFCILLILPAANAGFFTGLFGSNPITGFVDSITAPVQNFVGGVVQAASNFVGGLVQGASNAVGGIIGAITGSTPRPPGGGGGGGGGAGPLNPPGYSPWGGSGIGGGVEGQIETGDQPLRYVKRNTSYRSVTEIGFSHIQLSNLYIDTFLPHDDVYSGMYVNIFAELTNLGSKPGTTRVRNQVDCYKRDITGLKVSDYEVEFRTDWIEEGELEAGSVNSYLYVWFVPLEKYENGGHCKVTAEISDNVRRTNVIENVLCSIFSWATGAVTQDCTTTSEKEITVETRGQTIKELEFDIKPRVPELSGVITQDFNPWEFK